MKVVQSPQRRLRARVVRVISQSWKEGGLIWFTLHLIPSFAFERSRTRRSLFVALRGRSEGCNGYGALLWRAQGTPRASCVVLCGGPLRSMSALLSLFRGLPSLSSARTLRLAFRRIHLSSIINLLQSFICVVGLQRGFG